MHLFIHSFICLLILLFLSVGNLILIVCAPSGPVTPKNRCLPKAFDLFWMEEREVFYVLFCLCKIP